MGLPQFVKAGLMTLVFSRDVLLPYAQPVSYARRRKVSGGGVVRLAKTGEAERLITLRFEGLAEEDYLLLSAWFDDPLINEGLEPFTYVDGRGVSQLVYWWDDTFDMPEVQGGFYEVTLTLRKAS